MNSFMRQSSVPIDTVHSFLKDKHAWENAITVYQGPDPLDHWYNYICWYKNHGHGDPENKFRETLERCLTLYEHSDFYKQDPRMVRLWLKYIEMQHNPLHFYQVLHQRGVGKQLAMFYIAWASYYESNNALKEAEAVYNLGFQEKAQPYAELHHAYSKVVYARQLVAAQTTQQLRATHMQQPQQVQHIASQMYYGHQQQHEEANTSRTSDQEHIYKSTEQVAQEQSLQQNQQCQQYYNSTQQQQCYQQNINYQEIQQNYNEQLTQQPQQTYVEQQQQHQILSNDVNPSGVTEFAQGANSSQNIQRCSNSVPIEEQVTPSAVPSQSVQQEIPNPTAVETSILPIRLPPKFATHCYNNCEVWRPLLFLEELDDACRRCHYLKNLVYPAGADMEYSPEEIRARKYRFAYSHYKQNEENADANTDDLNEQLEVSQAVVGHKYSQQQVEINNDDHQNSEVCSQEEKFSTEQASGDESNSSNFSDNNEGNESGDYEENEDEYKNKNYEQAAGDLEDQIEASTIRFTTSTVDQGVQNKTIKIKFKKERAHAGSSINYSAYTVESVYKAEVSSPSTGLNNANNRRNGQSFHPYMLSRHSTPKTAGSKRAKTKLKRMNKFQIANESNSNSFLVENEATNDGKYTNEYHEGIVNGMHNVVYNDNANYSFSSATALDNSNCSITSAVGRLNFRDTTNAYNNNASVAADISIYQENSFFATQHDEEAQKRRFAKAEEAIERHLAKEAIDPFNSELCRAFLTKLNFPGTDDEHANYKIIQSALPKITNTKTLTLPDGIQFNIDKEVGRGSYGSVYKATDTKNGSVVALKYQKPPNTWEIYICDQVLKRINNPCVLPGLMDVSTAVIAPNASLIATEFSPFGSLLDINNKIRQATTKVMHESLVMHFSLQICSIVHELHKHKIIHADIKPDNFLLMRVPSTDLYYPSLRLIDFGCAIDMTLFPGHGKTKFRKVIQTDGFTCIEMQEGRPWSYETDLFCIAGTVHVMLFGEYMQLQKRGDTWDIKQKLPRYLKKHVWTKFFGDILNIKESEKLPDLNEMKLLFEEEAYKMDSELQKQIRSLSNILHRR